MKELWSPIYFFTYVFASIRRSICHIGKLNFDLTVSISEDQLKNCHQIVFITTEIYANIAHFLRLWENGFY